MTEDTQYAFHTFKVVVRRKPIESMLGPWGKLRYYQSTLNSNRAIKTAFRTNRTQCNIAGQYRGFHMVRAVFKESSKVLFNPKAHHRSVSDFFTPCFRPKSSTKTTKRPPWRPATNSKSFMGYATTQCSLGHLKKDCAKPTLEDKQISLKTNGSLFPKPHFRKSASHARLMLKREPLLD